MLRAIDVAPGGSFGTSAASSFVVVAPRILVLHDQRGLLQDVGRLCLRHQAPLHLARSQSELMDLVSERKQPIDLVIAKDVIPDDWFSISAILLAARASGLRMPFVVVAEPSDQWTKTVIQIAGPAAVID